MSTESETPETGGTPDASAAPSAAQAELSAAQAKIAELERELADARERADRYHSNWQRSAADFQNWKRRTDQEKADLGRAAEGAVTLELLRILDDFERAFQSLPGEMRTFTWIEGVYLIGQKLYSLLQARGLTPIEALGQEFDPYHHEAVLREDGSDGAETLIVVQELQRGYRFHDRVIRPTMVKVGPPPTTETATPDAEAAPSEQTSGASDEPVAS